MSSTRLVLIRHGHTEMNGGSPDPVMCGWTDVELTTLGEQQATSLQGAVHADVVYASPLTRARETARHCGGGDVICEPRLREIGCGNVDGVSLRAVQRGYPELWARNTAEVEDDFRWPGGESYAELRQRTIASVAAIVDKHAAERIAIVTHAGVITQLLGHITGTRPARWSAFRVGNASITELSWARDHGEIVSYNVRDHLPRALRT